MPETYKYMNFGCDLQLQGDLEELFWQAKNT